MVLMIRWRFIPAGSRQVASCKVARLVVIESRVSQAHSPEPSYGSGITLGGRNGSYRYSSRLNFE